MRLSNIFHDNRNMFISNIEFNIGHLIKYEFLFTQKPVRLTVVKPGSNGNNSSEITNPMLLLA